MVYDYPLNSYWYPSKRPSVQDFRMEIVSRNPDTDGKKVRNYNVDGINTIGVQENEPFEIWFHNNSSEAVSAIVSVDGFNCITAKPASLDANKDSMWFVRAHSTLHIKAWHESSEGGSRLVFTTPEKSVVYNKSGDMSHRGIIAVAVFTEQDNPRKIEEWTWRRTVDTRDDYFYGRRRSMGHILADDVTKGMVGGSAEGMSYSANASVGGAMTSGGIQGTPPMTDISDGAATMDFDYAPTAATGKGGQHVNSTRQTKSAAVGAGEYTSQKTHTVKGLDKPVLNCVVRTRYMFWDELVKLLETARPKDTFASGFPASANTFADLSSVPKTVSNAVSRTDKDASFDRVIQ